jgi:hypothetical protein
MRRRAPPAAQRIELRWHVACDGMRCTAVRLAPGLRRDVRLRRRAGVISSVARGVHDAADSSVDRHADCVRSGRTGLAETTR